MTRRSTGLAFFALATFLFAARLIAGALNGGFEGAAFAFAGWLAFIHLALGGLYLVWAELEERQEG